MELLMHAVFVVIIFCGCAFLVYYKNRANILFEKEACFDDVFNYSKIGMAIVTIDFKIKRVNDTLSEMLNISASALAEMSIGNIIHQEDRDTYLENINGLLNKEKNSYQMTYRCLNSMGEANWFFLTTSLIRDRRKKPLYFMLQVHSVASLINMHNQLIRNNDKCVDLINSCDNAITVLDKDFRCTIVNKHCVDLLNEFTGRSYDTTSIIGRKASEIFPECEHTPLYKSFMDIMVSRSSNTIINESKDSRGLSYWYEFHTIPVEDGIMILALNITERVLKEKAIAENEIKYRSLVEQSYHGMILMDEDGVVIEFNHQMENITGISKDEVIGGYIWNLYYKLSPPELKSKEFYGKTVENYKRKFQRDKVKADGKPRAGVIYRRDGSRCYVEDIYYPIVTDKAKYVCCICRDVTELRRLQEIKVKSIENDMRLKEAIEMDKLKTEFFANLSHEFRTPLNIILTSNDILTGYTQKEESLSKDYLRKYLNISKQNCYRLMRLINNIIDVTKIDAGFLFMDFKLYNIVSVIEDIAQSVVVYAENKNINVIFDTDIEEKYIRCDVDKMERIFLNLLSNAIKFTLPGGSININVSEEGEYVVIKIIDNGIGIPEGKISVIFDRFRQVDKSLTRRQEGSGIGLSLVKSLTEMHEGKIEVWSEVGKGTIFTIHLPGMGGVDEEIAVEEAAHHIYNDRVEKASMEFSDIYFD